MNQLHPLMNQQLANWTVLYTKLHNYHWYVKGAHFFTLHEQFEEYYNEAASNIDEIAERLLTIGGKPVATLKETLEVATIKEATGAEDANEMVKILAQDFTTLCEEIEQLMEAADGANDEATADLFLGIKGTLEKHIWMLNAFLG